jgi:hypothetical protein
MRTKEIKEKELHRIAKDIKTALRNDGDADKKQLIKEAADKYELTHNEEIQLNVLLAY